MREQPKFFAYFHEVLTRPAFDPECGITLENFASLVGEYKFADEVICQVHKADGRCGHKHQHGWVGKTKGGKEGLIGGHCAAKYFNASAEFALERSRIRRELNIDSYIRRLTDLLANGEFVGELATCLERVRYVRDSARGLLDELPRDIVDRLVAMSKTGNSGVAIEISYVEKVEDERTGKLREKNTWIEQPIGSIAGASVCNHTTFANLVKELKQIRDTAEVVEIRREVGERKLKAWVDTLSSVPQCMSRLDDLSNALDAFANPRNLRLLCFLSRRYESQIAALRAALARAGDESPSDARAGTVLNEMFRELRAAETFARRCDLLIRARVQSVEFECL